MTIHEVYKFLMGPHQKSLEIARKEKVIAEIKGCLLPGALRYDKDRVQTSPEDIMGKTMARVDELERQIEALRTQRSAMILQVHDAIERLDSDIEKLILTEWYIKRTKKNDIMKLLGYSDRHMFRYKNSGIRHLYEILKDVSECQ